MIGVQIQELFGNDIGSSCLKGFMGLMGHYLV
jgi:hypothetical protein